MRTFQEVKRALSGGGGGGQCYNAKRNIWHIISYMKTEISIDIYICIGVPLNIERR